MKKIFSVLAALAATLGVLVGLTACAPQTIDMSSVTAVIDVRTPEEFATGHLDGAVNINWESPSFTDEVAGLDRAGNYVLYCRSGNRAGQAMTAMENMGFTSLTNAGSVESASQATGLAVVP